MLNMEFKFSLANKHGLIYTFLKFSLDVSEASVEDQLINLDAPVSKETDSKDLFIV